MTKVKGLKNVRAVLTRGDCSEETYLKLTRIISRLGCLKSKPESKEAK
jgi:hypothetical protein